MTPNQVPALAVGTVGQTAAQADSTQPSFRLGRQSDLIVSELQPRCSEQNRRKNSFRLAIAATTTGVAAGQINGAVLSSITQFAIWNPLGSNFIINLKRLTFGLISGTIVGGPLLHNRFQIIGAMPANVGSSNSTTVNSSSNQLGAGFPSGAGYIASAAGISMIGGSALSLLGPSTIGYSAGSYADLGGQVAYEDIDGDIQILPGFGYVPTFAGAGTTVLNSWGLTWNEDPI